ncbi:MAG: redoxin domain-containing protein [Anaerolineales bacterium]|nr:redoxin domain-containing protein [Anaerolineales bacterium]
MSRQPLFIVLYGLILGAGLGLLIFIVIGVGQNSSDSDSILAGRNVPNAFGIGSPAVNFELEDLEGNIISLKDFRDKAVLINFWATWCGPCRFEMPAIQSRFDQYEDDLDVIAINFDEPARVVQQFIDELGLTFTVLLDPGGTVQREYRVRAYPTTYFLDKEGVVKFLHIGYMSESQIDQYLNQIGIGE